MSRPPRFSVSFRPILGPTQEQAWQRPPHPRPGRPPAPAASAQPRRDNPANAGSQRLLAFAAVGVTSFLIRGYDPLDDTVDYGRELVPAVRAAVAERDCASVAA